MIKMNNEVNKNNISREDNDSKISHIIPLGYKQQRENMFAQKGREYLKSKKAISMKHIFDSKEKININQNININANIKNTDQDKENDKNQDRNDSKPQNEEGKKKE